MVNLLSLTPSLQQGERSKPHAQTERPEIFPFPVFHLLATPRFTNTYAQFHPKSFSSFIYFFSATEIFPIRIAAPDSSRLSEVSYTHIPNPNKTRTNANTFSPVRFITLPTTAFATALSDSLPPISVRLLQFIFFSHPTHDALSYENPLRRDIQASLSVPLRLSFPRIR